MASIVLIGTLDTKGVEYAFVRQRIEALGHEVVLVDAGVMGEPDPSADISRDEVARAAGANITDLAAAGDRGRAVKALSEGARNVLLKLHAEGRVQGVAALGGSGGSSLAAYAMQALPIGVPKLIVSTVASGDTRAYVGVTDITMMHSVVDVAGINRISRRILANAAAAISGMAADFATSSVSQEDEPPLIAATMFGVTTPCIMAAKGRLEEHGFEVLVFHAVGTGGQSMEALVAGGFIAGVLDATTTELADELVGGVFTAGKDRLTVAGKAGVPQVVSLGALDMVNFGALQTVPARFRGRNLHVHNASITLMRTTPEECATLGREIAQKLSVAKGPVALFVPRRGISAISVRGGVFDDAKADAALFDAVTSRLATIVTVHDFDYDINDPRFAHAMADTLADMIRERADSRRETQA
jgi:uncharacterized protein (UPF0261 family)